MFTTSGKNIPIRPQIENNLSVRGRVECENEASESFPSPFA